MTKLFLFYLLWRITGNPILALLVFLVVVYFLDRRYVGLLPNVTRPFVIRKRMSELSHTLRLSPHDTSSKVELARLLLEKRRFAEALPLLRAAHQVMPESADVLYELGYCLLQLGQREEGEALLLQALKINPRVRYGEPYLRLGAAFASTQPEKALAYLGEFRAIQSSSIEGYYQMGQLYAELGKKAEAKQAFREALDVYRGLPKYKKRTERKWAWLSQWKQ